MYSRSFLSFVLFLVGHAARAAEEPIFASRELHVVAAAGVGGEGPAWHPELGILTSGNEQTYRTDPTGRSQVYREKSGTNGNLFDRQGRLVSCESINRRVVRQESDGKLTVLADTYDGKRFNQPNDLSLDSQDRIYFTDPRYGDRASMEIKDDQGRTIEGVYRIDAPGKVTRVIGREVDRANGILVAPDDKFLFVADNNNSALDGARKLWRFDLRGDGTVDVKSQKLLHDWGQGRGPDGLKQDRHGRLYVAAGTNKPNKVEPVGDAGGIYVFSPAGKKLDFLPVPTDEVTNCAFGQRDLKTLYITAGGTLYSVRTATAGRVVWPPTEMPRNR